MVHAVDFGQARLGGLIGRIYLRKHRTGLPRLRIVQARPPRALAAALGARADIPGPPLGAKNRQSVDHDGRAGIAN